MTQAVGLTTDLGGNVAALSDEAVEDRGFLEHAGICLPRRARYGNHRAALPIMDRVEYPMPRERR